MARKPPKGKSLAEVNPELAKQWHPTKNINLTPYDVTKGSNKKVWWKCNEGDDHEWEAIINSRRNGVGCPVCRGLKVVPSNSLATLNPKIAKQWHPTKNGDLSPFDVVPGSHKKVWWQCDKSDDHIWNSPIYRRIVSGCPACAGQIVVESNSLATLDPKLAKEWHPFKNGELTPFDVVHRSEKKVWWKCDQGDDHEWKANISNRSRGTGCPICKNLKVVSSNCLATTRPEIAKQWHPTKNGDLSPFDVVPGSHKKVWWQCDKSDDHIWISQISSRLVSGCPACANRM